jgi:hypothetical protein
MRGLLRTPDDGCISHASFALKFLTPRLRVLCLKNTPSIETTRDTVDKGIITIYLISRLVVRSGFIDSNPEQNIATFAPSRVFGLLGRAQSYGID